MVEKTEFLQAIDDAILDADSLERFINGSDSETVLTRLSAEYPTLQNAIKQMFENIGIAGRYEKYAELETSGLVDGDYALVADDTSGNNGIYIKKSGVWLKSSYNPLPAMQEFLRLSNIKLESELTDKFDGDLGLTRSKNLFDGVYHKGGMNTYTFSRGSVIRSDNSEYYGDTSNIAIIPVKPNQNYSVKLHGVDRKLRFRIASFKGLPSILSHDIPYDMIAEKDKGKFLLNFNGFGQEVVVESNYEAVVTTPSDAKYLLVMAGDAGLQPKLQVELGSVPTPYVDGGISINSTGIIGQATSQAISDFETNHNKNLFNGKYLWASIYRWVVNQNPRYVMDDSTVAGVLAEIKIEGNTTYTLSSPDPELFNRYRIGLVNKKPVYYPVRLAASLDDVVNDVDGYKEITFTTGANSEYVLVYVSTGTGGKPRLQLEKGSVATAYTEPSQNGNELIKSAATVKSQNIFNGNVIAAKGVTTDASGVTLEKTTGFPFKHISINSVDGSSNYTLSASPVLLDGFKVYLWDHLPEVYESGSSNSASTNKGVLVESFKNTTTNSITFQTNPSTKYVVLELLSGNLTSDVQLEKGSIASEYKDNYLLPSKLLEVTDSSGSGGSGSKLSLLDNLKPFHFMTDLDSLYLTETPITGFFDNPKLPTAADIYQLYDDLVAAHPGYFIKTSLGVDSYGYPISSYTTKPPSRYLSPIQGFDPTNSINTVLDVPKIVMVSGVHGTERVAVYSIYYFMRDMLNNTNADESLAFLKRNVQFVVCPIVNNSGFDDSTYLTRAGGNINRDFNLSGSVTLPESVILKDFLNSHSDMDFYIDYHSSNSIKNQLGYLLSSQPIFQETGAQIFQEMGAVWQKREPRISQDPRQVWGFVMDLFDGIVGSYVEKFLKVPAVLPETRYTLPNVDIDDEYNADAVRLGYELLVNCIRMCLRESKRSKRH